MSSNFVGENIGSASSPVIVTAASCPVAVTYPVGSASYTTTGKSTESATYMLWGSSPTVTDETGLDLTALPVIGTRFCMNGDVYDPIAGATAATDNYNVYYDYTTPFGCTSASISSALKKQKNKTVLISLKATGNTAVPDLFNIKTTIGAGSYFEEFYVSHLGKVMTVEDKPAFTFPTSTHSTANITAANAQLKANGLPPLP
jgi:hypothetical protein